MQCTDLFCIICWGIFLEFSVRMIEIWCYPIESERVLWLLSYDADVEIHIHSIIEQMGCLDSVWSPSSNSIEKWKEWMERKNIINSDPRHFLGWSRNKNRTCDVVASTTTPVTDDSKDATEFGWCWRTECKAIFFSFFDAGNGVLFKFESLVVKNKTNNWKSSRKFILLPENSSAFSWMNNVCKICFVLVPPSPHQTHLPRSDTPRERKFRWITPSISLLTEFSSSEKVKMFSAEKFLADQSKNRNLKKIVHNKELSLYSPQVPK